jgi:ribosomal-protein-alanine N-acetyltransferase
MGQRVTLRAFSEDDLPFLDQLCTDPEALGYFQWYGFIDVRTRRRRWEQDGYISPESTALGVVLADGTLAGITSWRKSDTGPAASACYEIGAALLPEHRGLGLGTEAQRTLVDHLFNTTIAHRLEAYTDAENIAEQRALERIGFQREGVLREVIFMHGTWRHIVLYSLLRSDPRG